MAMQHEGGRGHGCFYPIFFCIPTLEWTNFYGLVHVFGSLLSPSLPPWLLSPPSLPPTPLL